MMERFRKRTAWMDRPDSAALHGLISGVVWMVIGVTIGFTMSNEMTSPDLFAGIPYLVFSRLRPVHVNMMLFGFLSTAFFGAWYYVVPRLCQCPLWTDRAANTLLILWNIGVAVASISLVCGITQGKEYAEYPWYANWLIEALLIVNIVIIFGTIARRKEPKLFVSLWYIGGSTVWIAMNFAVGHVIWHPFTTTLPNGQIQYAGSLIGLNDAIWNWFYGHNVFGLYITTGGIGIMYYMVPKITRRPLYSHTMSLVGFWSIALLYSNTGAHHLLQVPIPNWLKIVAIIGSFSLIIPVFTFNTNLFMTMRGVWGKMMDDAPLRFIITGAFFYLAVSVQGSIQSLMSVNRFTHYTQWVIAHSHLALLGAFGFVGSGAVLYMVPKVVGKPLWSRNLADFQYWLMLLGVTGFFWSLTVAGLAQGTAWIYAGQQEVRVYELLKPYFYMRTWFGGMAAIGVYAMLINVIATVLQPALDPSLERKRRIAEIEDIPIPVGENRAVLVD
jgi:cbb3-type cytochrome c oxidase subunit I